jgi:cytochrome c-type biogenesis protein CcmH/NrfG
MNAPASLIEAAELSEAQQRYELRESERADMSTRASREAMRAIAWITERAVLSLIACLIDIVSRASWSHTEAGHGVLEALGDAVFVLETSIEKHGG